MSTEYPRPLNTPDYPQPEILREAGYDQTAVPSEQANQTPKAKPTIEDVEEES